MRFVVRESRLDGHETVYRVWDSGLHVWTFAFTREALAIACSRRLEQDHLRRLARAPEVLAPVPARADWEDRG